MHVTILANPRSGRGKALALADRLDAILTARGHTTLRPLIDPDLNLAEAAGGSDRLVIVGGDGTIHHAARAAAESGVPVYHLATGTENLFARYFRMPRDPEQAAERLERDHPPSEIDLGTANGVPFTLMCSVGIDASVIHRVEDVRGAKGGHLAYVRPTLAEGLSPRAARLDIEADGTPLIAGFVGTAVVSNIPAYALRMDPAFDADPSDGRLDLALLPYATSVGTAYGFLRSKLRSKSIRRVRAARFVIRPSEPASPETNPVQIDGERPRPDSPLPRMLGPGSELALGLLDRRLKVHAPPGR
tara:strand:+ start:44638 stop:45546 length:909 start_codon:yes stop_codon:yes gene_type:complete